MRISVDRLFFAHPIVVPNTDATGSETSVEELGFSNAPEAFFTKASRDPTLGLAAQNIEFVPVFWAEAVESGFNVANIAIGPRLGAHGFNQIADLVIPAVVSDLLDWMVDGASQSEVAIARLNYTVGIRHGEVWVGGDPSADNKAGRIQMEATMAWLRDRVTRELRSRNGH